MTRKCLLFCNIMLLSFFTQVLIIVTVPLISNSQIQDPQDEHDEPQSLKKQILKQHLEQDEVSCNTPDCSDIMMNLDLPTQRPSQLTTSHQASFGESVNHLATGAAVPVAPEQQSQRAEVAARQQQQQQLQLRHQQLQQQLQQQQSQQHLQQQYHQPSSGPSTNQAHHQGSTQQLIPQQQLQVQHQQPTPSPPSQPQSQPHSNPQTQHQLPQQQHQQQQQQPTTPSMPLPAQVQTPSPTPHPSVSLQYSPNVVRTQQQTQAQQQLQPQPQPQPQPQQQSQQISVPRESIQHQQPALSSYSPPSYHHHSNSPLYFGHNPFIERLRPQSYADDNIVTLNLSHSHIYEIDSDAFVGQRFEHIDLSNNKLGLIHSRSFRIGPFHSKHTPYNPHSNSSKPSGSVYPTRRPPPAHPKSVTIDFSHNPAIVALSGAFDHIDVPNCLLNFTNSTVELKFGAFKKYFKEHPGHIIDIESVDCCEQEWLLGYKHNFVSKTHCDHDPNLFLTKVPQQQIIDSCIAYVTSARHSMTIQGPSIIHQVAALPRSHSNSHADNQYTTYLILGGTAMILTSLSIYIIFYMFSLKAAFVYQMQNKN